MSRPIEQLELGMRLMAEGAAWKRAGEGHSDGEANGDEGCPVHGLHTTGRPSGGKSGSAERQRRRYFAPVPVLFPHPLVRRAGVANQMRLVHSRYDRLRLRYRGAVKISRTALIIRLISLSVSFGVNGMETVRSPIYAALGNWSCL
jgi:hypothetical protein